MKNEKDSLYFGAYKSVNNKFVLKVGTTNDEERREKEHNRYYKKASHEPIAETSVYKMFESIPLSKYNALRFEDKVKEQFIEQGFGEYIKNDRFVFDEVPDEIHITIRKEYVFYPKEWVW